MTVAFVDIEDKFDRVFGFIRCDLERILTLDPGGLCCGDSRSLRLRDPSAIPL